LRILGIDPGTEATGFGVIDSDGERHSLCEFGVIASPKAASFARKLQLIHQGLQAVIDRRRPDGVVVENLFYAANVKSALRLGHARGVALLAAVQNQLPLFEYSPLEVKQTVVGYGRADKTQIQHMVMFLLRLAAPPEPHDAADALAVALCHAHRLRFAEKTGQLAGK
jgi:crossover junction endodeoxyribonuclease RuvC